MKTQKLTALLLAASILTACGAAGESENSYNAENSDHYVLPTFETIETTAAEAIILQTTEPDFRNVKWGMTKDEVKALEEESCDIEGNDYLSYNDLSVAGLDANLVYLFDDNEKLYLTGYVINEKYSDANMYISDYNALIDVLTEKYGTPDNRDTIWRRGNLFKYDPECYDLAIAEGDMVYLSYWETPSTSIELSLSGDNHKAILRLRYRSNTYKPVEKSSTDGL